MAAQDILNQRLQQEQNDYQQSFQREWQIVNQRFGAATNNPRIEDARRRALSSLHQQWAAKADALTRSYNKRLQGMQEVDRLGMNTDLAEETKMRLIEPTEVERALFPKPEKEADPLKAYDQLYLHGQKVASELERFETEGPSSIKVRRGGLLGLVPGMAGRRVEVPGGGVLVVEEIFDEKSGKTKKVRRNATQEEIEQWAALTNEKERTSEEKKKLLEQIRRSDHTAARLRLAAVNSPRMGGGGTFAEKAVQPKQEETPKRGRDPLGLGL